MIRYTMILAVLALAACSPQQAAQTLAVTQAVCQVDATAQPIVVALGAPVVTAVVPTAAPAVAGAVALDTAAIHPAIVAACAAYGAVPVAAK